VLVLRTRPVGFRQPGLVALGDSVVMRDNAALAELLRARRGVYNRQAAALERAEGRDGPHLQQVAVPAGTRLVRRLGINAERVTDALRLGAKAMASAILTKPIDLCWQPVVYRASPPDRQAERRAPVARPRPAAEISR